MPVGDIGRVGPNEDINDPTSVVEIAESLQNASNILYNDIFNESPLQIIFPISTRSGSIEDIDSIQAREGTDWTKVTINTYIDLAEKFRDYWNTINNKLDEISSVFVSGVSTSDFIPPSAITTESGSFGLDVVGTLINYFENSLCYTINTSGITPAESLDEPQWSGVGPTNYNSGTYPQLLLESENITPIITPGIFSSLGCENLRSQTFDKYGKQSVLSPNIFIGTERSDSPLIELIATLGVSKPNISSTLTFPSDIDILIINPYDEPLTINYSSSSNSNINASLTHSAGGGGSFDYLLSVYSAIQVVSTDIFSTDPVTIWPYLYTQYSGPFNSFGPVSGNPALASDTLNSSIAGSFVLDPQQKCIVRISNLANALITSIPVYDAFFSGGIVFVTGAYTINGTISANINCDKFSISRLISRSLSD